MAVWVVGSINMDLVAIAPHHPKVGETVLGSDLRRFPGGKGANQAVGAARAGSAVVMLGRVGADDFGRELVGFLREEGVEVGPISTADAPTGTALIVVAESDNTIVVIPGANSGLSERAVEAAADFAPGDVVVAQLETPQETTQRAFELAHESGALTVLNAAPAAQIGTRLIEETDYLVVNETELELLADDLALTITPTVICTLGDRGVQTVKGRSSRHTPGIEVDVVDTTGAGDCFVGYLAAGLDARIGLDEAVDRANRAAALSVRRPGAAPSIPTAAELDQVG